MSRDTEKRRKWWAENRERICARKRAKYRARCVTNIYEVRAERVKYSKAPRTAHQRKLNSLRAALSALIRGKRRLQILDLLGCTRDELLAHLERQFAPGWSWSDYGVKFEVDHIKPCRDFDLSDPDDQADCFHYTNLRPLENGTNRAWRRFAIAA